MSRSRQSSLDGRSSAPHTPVIAGDPWRAGSPSLLPVGGSAPGSFSGGYSSYPHPFSADAQAPGAATMRGDLWRVTHKQHAGRGAKSWVVIQAGRLSIYTSHSTQSRLLADVAFRHIRPVFDFEHHAKADGDLLSGAPHGGDGNRGRGRVSVRRGSQGKSIGVSAQQSARFFYFGIEIVHESLHPGRAEARKQLFVFCTDSREDHEMWREFLHSPHAGERRYAYDDEFEFIDGRSLPQQQQQQQQQRASSSGFNRLNSLSRPPRPRDEGRSELGPEVESLERHSPLANPVSAAFHEEVEKWASFATEWRDRAQSLMHAVAELYSLQRITAANPGDVADNWKPMASELLASLAEQRRGDLRAVERVHEAAAGALRTAADHAAGILRGAASAVALATDEIKLGAVGPRRNLDECTSSTSSTTTGNSAAAETFDALGARVKELQRLLDMYVGTEIAACDVINEFEKRQRKSILRDAGTPQKLRHVFASLMGMVSKQWQQQASTPRGGAVGAVLSSRRRSASECVSTPQQPEKAPTSTPAAAPAISRPLFNEHPASTIVGAQTPLDSERESDADGALRTAAQEIVDAHKATNKVVPDAPLAIQLTHVFRVLEAPVQHHVEATVASRTEYLLSEVMRLKGAIDARDGDICELRESLVEAREKLDKKPAVPRESISTRETERAALEIIRELAAKGVAMPPGSTAVKLRKAFMHVSEAPVQAVHAATPEELRALTQLVAMKGEQIKELSRRLEGARKLQASAMRKAIASSSPAPPPRSVASLEQPPDDPAAPAGPADSPSYSGAAREVMQLEQLLAEKEQHVQFLRQELGAARESEGVTTSLHDLHVEVAHWRDRALGLESELLRLRHEMPATRSAGSRSPSPGSSVVAAPTHHHPTPTRDAREMEHELALASQKISALEEELLRTKATAVPQKDEVQRFLQLLTMKNKNLAELQEQLARQKRQGQRSTSTAAPPARTYIETERTALDIVGQCTEDPLRLTIPQGQTDVQLRYCFESLVMANKFLLDQVATLEFYQEQSQAVETMIKEHVATIDSTSVASTTVTLDQVTTTASAAADIDRQESAQAANDAPDAASAVLSPRSEKLATRDQIRKELEACNDAVGRWRALVKTCETVVGEVESLPNFRGVAMSSPSVLLHERLDKCVAFLLERYDTVSAQLDSSSVFESRAVPSLSTTLSQPNLSTCDKQQQTAAAVTTSDAGTQGAPAPAAAVTTSDAGTQGTPAPAAAVTTSDAGTQGAPAPAAAVTTSDAGTQGASSVVLRDTVCQLTNKLCCVLDRGDESLLTLALSSDDLLASKLQEVAGALCARLNDYGVMRSALDETMALLRGQLQLCRAGPTVNSFTREESEARSPSPSRRGGARGRSSRGRPAVRGVGVSRGGSGHAARKESKSTRTSSEEQQKCSPTQPAPAAAGVEELRQSLSVLARRVDELSALEQVVAELVAARSSRIATSAVDHSQSRDEEAASPAAADADSLGATLRSLIGTLEADVAEAERHRTKLDQQREEGELFRCVSALFREHDSTALRPLPKGTVVKKLDALMAIHKQKHSEDETSIARLREQIVKLDATLTVHSQRGKREAATVSTQTQGALDASAVSGVLSGGSPASPATPLRRGYFSSGSMFASAVDPMLMETERAAQQVLSDLDTEGLIRVPPGPTARRLPEAVGALCDELRRLRHSVGCGQAARSEAADAASQTKSARDEAEPLPRPISPVRANELQALERAVDWFLEENAEEGEREGSEEDRVEQLEAVNRRLVKVKASLASAEVRIEALQQAQASLMRTINDIQGGELGGAAGGQANVVSSSVIQEMQEQGAALLNARTQLSEKSAEIAQLHVALQQAERRHASVGTLMRNVEACVMSLYEDHLDLGLRAHAEWLLRCQSQLRCEHVHAREKSLMKQTERVEHESMARDLARARREAEDAHAASTTTQRGKADMEKKVTALCTGVWEGRCNLSDFDTVIAQDVKQLRDLAGSLRSEVKSLKETKLELTAKYSNLSLQNDDNLQKLEEERRVTREKRRELEELISELDSVKQMRDEEIRAAEARFCESSRMWETDLQTLRARLAALQKANEGMMLCLALPTASGAEHHGPFDEDISSMHEDSSSHAVVDASNELVTWARALAGGSSVDDASLASILKQFYLWAVHHLVPLHAHSPSASIFDMVRDVARCFMVTTERLGQMFAATPRVRAAQHVDVLSLCHGEILHLRNLAAKIDEAAQHIVTESSSGDDDDQHHGRDLSCDDKSTSSIEPSDELLERLDALIHMSNLGQTVLNILDLSPSTSQLELQDELVHLKQSASEMQHLLTHPVFIKRGLDNAHKVPGNLFHLFSQYSDEHEQLVDAVQTSLLAAEAALEPGATESLTNLASSEEEASIACVTRCSQAMLLRVKVVEHLGAELKRAREDAQIYLARMRELLKSRPDASHYGETLLAFFSPPPTVGEEQSTPGAKWDQAVTAVRELCTSNTVLTKSFEEKEQQLAALNIKYLEAIRIIDTSINELQNKPEVRELAFETSASTEEVLERHQLPMAIHDLRNRTKASDVAAMTFEMQHQRTSQHLQHLHDQLQHICTAFLRNGDEQPQPSYLTPTKTLTECEDLTTSIHDHLETLQQKTLERKTRAANVLANNTAGHLRAQYYFPWKTFSRNRSRTRQQTEKAAQLLASSNHRWHTLLTFAKWKHANDITQTQKSNNGHLLHELQRRTNAQLLRARMRTWTAWVGRLRELRTKRRIAETFIQSTDNGLRMVAFRRLRELVVQRRAVRQKRQMAETLFGRSSEGLRMIMYRRWRLFAGHRVEWRQQREQRREVGLRYVERAAAMQRLRSCFGQWGRVVVQHRHLRVTHHALGLLRAAAERGLQRVHYQRLRTFAGEQRLQRVTKAASMRRAGRVADVLLARTQRLLLAAAYRRLQGFAAHVRATRAQRQRHGSLSDALQRSTNAQLLRARMRTWTAWVGRLRELRTKRRIAETFIQSTDNGLRMVAFRRLRELVVQRRAVRQKRQMAETLFGRSSEGLRMIMYRRWRLFAGHRVEWRQQREQRREVGLRYVERAAAMQRLRSCFGQWGKFLQVVRMRNSAVQLSLLLSARSKSTLLQRYFNKLRLFSATVVETRAANAVAAVYADAAFNNVRKGLVSRCFFRWRSSLAARVCGRLMSEADRSCMMLEEVRIALGATEADEIAASVRRMRERVSVFDGIVSRVSPGATEETFAPWLDKLLSSEVRCRALCGDLGVGDGIAMTRSDCIIAIREASCILATDGVKHDVLPPTVDEPTRLITLAKAVQQHRLEKIDQADVLARDLEEVKGQLSLLVNASSAALKDLGTVDVSDTLRDSSRSSHISAQRSYLSEAGAEPHQQHRVSYEREEDEARAAGAQSSPERRLISPPCPEPSTALPAMAISLESRASAVRREMLQLQAQNQEVYRILMGSSHSGAVTVDDDSKVFPATLIEAALQVTRDFAVTSERCKRMSDDLNRLNHREALMLHAIRTSMSSLDLSTHGNHDDDNTEEYLTFACDALPIHTSEAAQRLAKQNRAVQQSLRHLEHAGIDESAHANSVVQGVAVLVDRHGVLREEMEHAQHALQRASEKQKRLADDLQRIKEEGERTVAELVEEAEDRSRQQRQQNAALNEQVSSATRSVHLYEAFASDIARALEHPSDSSLADLTLEDRLSQLVKRGDEVLQLLSSANKASKSLAKTASRLEEQLATVTAEKEVTGSLLEKTQAELQRMREELHVTQRKSRNEQGELRERIAQLEQEAAESTAGHAARLEALAGAHRALQCALQAVADRLHVQCPLVAALTDIGPVTNACDRRITSMEQEAAALRVELQQEQLRNAEIRQRFETEVGGLQEALRTTSDEVRGFRRKETLLLDEIQELLQKHHELFKGVLPENLETITVFSLFETAVSLLAKKEEEARQLDRKHTAAVGELYSLQAENTALSEHRTHLEEDLRACRTAVEEDNCALRAAQSRILELTGVLETMNEKLATIFDMCKSATADSVDQRIFTGKEAPADVFNNATGLDVLQRVVQGLIQRMASMHAAGEVKAREEALLLEVRQRDTQITRLERFQSALMQVAVQFGFEIDAMDSNPHEIVDIAKDCRSTVVRLLLSQAQACGSEVNDETLRSGLENLLLVVSRLHSSFTSRIVGAAQALNRVAENFSEVHVDFAGFSADQWHSWASSIIASHRELLLQQLGFVSRIGDAIAHYGGTYVPYIAQIPNMSSVPQPLISDGHSVSSRASASRGLSPPQQQQQLSPLAVAGLLQQLTNGQESVSAGLHDLLKSLLGQQMTLRDEWQAVQDKLARAEQQHRAYRQQQHQEREKFQHQFTEWRRLVQDKLAADNDLEARNRQLEVFLDEQAHEMDKFHIDREQMARTITQMRSLVRHKIRTDHAAERDLSSLRSFGAGSSSSGVRGSD